MENYYKQILNRDKFMNKYLDFRLFILFEFILFYFIFYCVRMYEIFNIIEMFA